MITIGPYIPVLRTKAGEFRALKELSEIAINNINPLFDFHRLPLNDDKPFSEHIENICNKLV